MSAFNKGFIVASVLAVVTIPTVYSRQKAASKQHEKATIASNKFRG